MQQTTHPPFCRLDDYFIGYVVLAVNQGQQTWLWAGLHVVTYSKAARNHDCWDHFYKRFS